MPRVRAAPRARLAVRATDEFDFSRSLVGCVVGLSSHAMHRYVGHAPLRAARDRAAFEREFPAEEDDIDNDADDDNDAPSQRPPRDHASDDGGGGARRRRKQPSAAAAAAPRSRPASPTSKAAATARPGWLTQVISRV